MTRLRAAVVCVMVAFFLPSELKTFGQKPIKESVDVSAGSEKNNERTALRDELLRMGEQDQVHRTELEAKALELSKAGTTVPSEALLALFKKQDEIDKRNLARLEEIVMMQGWPGKGANQVYE